jgi:hypothetical protein
MVLGIKWMQGKHHGHALLDEDGDLDTEYIDDEDAKTEKQLARERERADRQNNGADEFASGPPSFASDASHDAMGSPGPKSPSDHAARKWLRKTQSRRGASKSFSQPAISYAEQMRLEALQEYQSRLAEPMKLDNETLISFASRVVIELEMRPYKTIKTLHSKTFTGADFIEWSMTQPEVRDQCDALFIGNELMSRGIFLPVSYGATEALFYSPTFKSSSGVMRLVCKKKAQIVAAVLGADLDTIGDLSSKRDSNASSPGAGNSASSSPRHGELSRDGSGKIDVGGVRRTASDPTSGSSSSSPAAAGGAGGESKFKLRRCPTVDERRGNVSSLKAVPEGRILRKFTNAVGGGINRRVLSTRAKFAAIARPIHGYLHTRLGPHVLFAALLPRDDARRGRGVLGRVARRGRGLEATEGLGAPRPRGGAQEVSREARQREGVSGRQRERGLVELRPAVLLGRLARDVAEPAAHEHPHGRPRAREAVVLGEFEDHGV